MTNLHVAPHEVTADGCVPDLHCFSCNRDEDGRSYISCGECGHIYPTAGSLRRAYRRVHTQILRHGWHAAPWLPQGPSLPLVDSRVERVWVWLRSRFVRASSINFCQECIHDF